MPLTPPALHPPPTKEFTTFEAGKMEARLDSFLIRVVGTQVKTRVISEKRGENPGCG